MSEGVATLKAAAEKERKEAAGRESALQTQLAAAKKALAERDGTRLASTRLAS